MNQNVTYSRRWWWRAEDYDLLSLFVTENMPRIQFQHLCRLCSCSNTNSYI